MTSYNVQSMLNSVSIQFETDNKDHYDRVQKVIRECIDEEAAAKILPCPFCGAAVEVREISTAAGPHYAVSCVNNDCDVKPGIYICDTRKDAIDRWNRRAGK